MDSLIRFSKKLLGVHRQTDTCSEVIWPSDLEIMYNFTFLRKIKVSRSQKKLQFQESQNWDFYWQCALYSSPIGWATAQQHYFKRINNLAQKMSPKRALKLVLWLPEVEDFLFLPRCPLRGYVAFLLRHQLGLC